MALRIENKLTFIHVSHSAGTAVCKFLKENFVCENIGRQHETYDQLSLEFRDDTFAVVRNTYDRVVSLYEKDRTIFGSKNNHTYKKEFALLEKGFDCYVKNLQEYRFDKHMVGRSKRRTWAEQTQLRFLPDDLNLIKLIRFDNVEKDLYQYLQDRGLMYNSPLQRRNATKTREGRNYKDYYNSETIKIVSRIYADEIEKLKFCF
jgi:hypothetical protein